MFNYPLSKKWEREGIKSSWMQPEKGDSNALTGKQQRHDRDARQAVNMASECG